MNTWQLAINENGNTVLALWTAVRIDSNGIYGPASHEAVWDYFDLGSDECICEERICNCTYDPEA